MDSKLLVGLCVGLVVYVVIGGVVLNVLEGSTEEENRQLSLHRNLRWLEDHQCVHQTEFVVLVRRILSEGLSGAILAQNTTTATNWDVASAIFFATSAVTTIGYGPISPQTEGGRGFLVCFVLVGIPMCVGVLGGLGTALARLTRRLPSLHRPALHAVLRVVVVSVSGGLVWLVVTAALLQAAEGTWSYWDAWYFMFITMTTIGFGDLVIGRLDQGELRYWYRPVVALWILLGLVWVATIIATVRDLCRASWEVRQITHTKKGLRKGSAESNTVYVVEMGDNRGTDNLEVYELSSMSTIHRSRQSLRSNRSVKERKDRCASLDRICHSIKSVNPETERESQSGVPNAAFVMEDEEDLKRKSVKMEDTLEQVPGEEIATGCDGEAASVSEEKSMPGSPERARPHSTEETEAGVSEECRPYVSEDTEETTTEKDSAISVETCHEEYDTSGDSPILEDRENSCRKSTHGNPEHVDPGEADEHPSESETGNETSKDDMVNVDITEVETEEDEKQEDMDEHGKQEDMEAPKNSVEGLPENVENGKQKESQEEETKQEEKKDGCSLQ